MKTFGKITDQGVKISPEGWAREFLLRQKNGLTGNIERSGEPFVSFGWDKINYGYAEKVPADWRWVEYEQVAYHLDGAVNCGNLLGDAELKKRTDEIIYAAIENADGDGYIGPSFLKEAGKCNRWPHAVFFRAVIAKYYETGDVSLINKLVKHYLSDDPSIYFKGRNFVNTEIMLTLYSLTGNEELLSRAEGIYNAYHSDEEKDADYCSSYTLARRMLDGSSPYEHGVTYNEIAKIGAALYCATGNEAYLKPAVNAYKKIDRYHMLPDGLHSCNEYFRGKKPRETHETCDISDFTRSLCYLLKATGDGAYADRTEQCIYNAGIGSVTEDFKALQYFSGLNQIVADDFSNHNIYKRGSGWMAYRPGHETQCCAGNVNRFFPNFVAKTFMLSGDTIFAVFYNDGLITCDTGGKTIKIRQKTDYPFSDSVTFIFESNADKILNFAMRIPGWCKTPSAEYNGKPLEVKTKKGFFTVGAKFVKGDVIKLKLPSLPEVVPYGKNGVFVRKGPLLYACGCRGERIPTSLGGRFSDDFPAYKMYADKEWNYGVSPSEADPRFVFSEKAGYPWDIKNCPAAIEITARKIPEWKIEEKHKVLSFDSEDGKHRSVLKGRFSFTPDLPKGNFKTSDPERILLFPFGVCKMRISVFPKINL
ncbi:MAG: glycoside hydrolase family 127 protein [Clostridia bacterium]|nr:glycoside hydrolase family 127 protein [Clostridia bacterium]